MEIPEIKNVLKKQVSGSVRFLIRRQQNQTPRVEVAPGLTGKSFQDPPATSRALVIRKKSPIKTPPMIEVEKPKLQTISHHIDYFGDKIDKN